MKDSKLLLVAEDNPADVYLIQLALKRHNIACEVHIVGDGESAVRFIEKTENDESSPCPSLALLDLNLPRVRGDQILQRLRGSSRWCRVPVIVISSSRSNMDRAAAMNSGASAFFSKPTGLDQFLELGSLIKSLLPAA